MASAALDGVASQQTDRFAVWLVLNNETQVWLRCTCVSFLMLRCGIAPDFLLFGEEHMNYSPEMVELVNNLKMVTGRIEGEIKNSLLKTTNQKR